MSPIEIVILGAVGGIVGIVLAVIYLYFFEKELDKSLDTPTEDDGY